MRLLDENAGLMKSPDLCRWAWCLSNGMNFLTKKDGKRMAFGMYTLNGLESNGFKLRMIYVSFTSCSVASSIDQIQLESLQIRISIAATWHFVSLELLATKPSETLPEHRRLASVDSPLNFSSRFRFSSSTSKLRISIHPFIAKWSPSRHYCGWFIRLIWSVD